MTKLSYCWSKPNVSVHHHRNGGMCSTANSKLNKDSVKQLGSVLTQLVGYVAAKRIKNANDLICQFSNKTAFQMHVYIFSHISVPMDVNPSSI